jgi:hypothetical protein
LLPDAVLGCWIVEEWASPHLLLLICLFIHAGGPLCAWQFRRRESRRGYNIEVPLCFSSLGVNTYICPMLITFSLHLRAHEKRKEELQLSVDMWVSWFVHTVCSSFYDVFVSLD